jgi:hypothetical protein
MIAKGDSNYRPRRDGYAWQSRSGLRPDPRRLPLAESPASDERRGSPVRAPHWLRRVWARFREWLLAPVHIELVPWTWQDDPPHSVPQTPHKRANR